MAKKKSEKNGVNEFGIVSKGSIDRNVVTIEKIRELMLKYMDSISGDIKRNTHYYDEDGYCGELLFNQIKTYWLRDFNTEEDLNYVISGRWASDDLEFEGGRSNIMKRSGIIPIIYRYLRETVKMDLNTFKSKIFNSVEFNELLIEMYNSDVDFNEIKTNDIINAITVVEAKQEVVEETPSETKDIWADIFSGTSNVANETPIVSEAPTQQVVKNNIESYENAEKQMRNDLVEKVRASLGVESEQPNDTRGAVQMPRQEITHQTMNESIASEIRSESQVSEQPNTNRTTVESENLNFIYIPRFIKYPVSMKTRLDRQRGLKFLCHSEQTPNFVVYEVIEFGVEIPTGGEVIKL